MFFLNKFNLILITLFYFLSHQTFAASWNDGAGGASRDHYFYAAGLRWDKKMGDWRDAENNSWGEVPFASQTINNLPANSKVSFDVTLLVKKWMTDEYENEGFFLRGVKGKSIINFFSRESNELLKPRLILVTNLAKYNLLPTADTYLHSSTIKPLGRDKRIIVSTTSPSLIHFDLGHIEKGEIIYSANLELTVKKIYNPRTLEIGVYQVAPAPVSSIRTQVEIGLADAHVWDKGLEENPDVYYSTGFEQSGWQEAWVFGRKTGQIVEDISENKFQSLFRNALEVKLDQGEKLALNDRFKFSQNGFPEPEEAYFRYYLRLGDDWNQTVSGGKLPGFAGTYNRAGWGSRKPDGTNGWSARGSFLKTIGTGSERLNPIGSYVYHVDQEGRYGTGWTWNRQGGALLKNNQWYCIEQHIKLNTPGYKDGVLTAWLDGRKIFQITGLQFRTTNKLKIEEVWMNFYHGGTAVSPINQTAYIDNFVVAKKYIGPIKKQ